MKDNNGNVGDAHPDLLKAAGAKSVKADAFSPRSIRRDMARSIAKAAKAAKPKNGFG